MDVHMEVWLDGPAAVRAARAKQWFVTCGDRLFPDCSSANTAWSASLVRHEDDPPEIFEGAGRQHEFLDELARPHYWAQLQFGDTGDDGRVRSSAAYPAGDFTALSTAVDCGGRSWADTRFCERLVETVVAAADEADPTFGRIEYREFSDRSNLDIALRRKKRVFLTEARDVLRGYAWVTVCPEGLLGRLGGLRALESSGAFHRVIPLSAGGAVLQASGTMAGYTDPVMEGVFGALAPVLPAGVPSDHPAFPGVRFVRRDARAMGA
ncbi:hypothetical protein [Streptomyces flavofungini]|uniref:hypothetical protein n=1 Tax=Streptomyces flavofungini TaxID=68200 RepID=UPI0025B050CF|nr:hypothetical protein [Streptomyces flavofungini]WJV46671.1 hypothetical protein QUY26_14765 [Streptomyces flavofungini]